MLNLKNLWRSKRRAKPVKKVEHMLSWKTDRAQILQSIAAVNGKLKVVLKTKDDDFFIEKWIQHYANIIGIENIIIFDNESTNERTLQSYAKYDDLLVVGFDGFHNLIHHVHLFPELYEALQASSQYFTFLDTDEFLVRYDQGVVRKDESILETIPPEARDGFIPTTWLYNQAGYEHRFTCGIERTVLNNGLIWGKPIISSSAPIAGSINHNCQIAEKTISVAPIGGLFLLHMAYLSPQQRIRTNLNKLVARGFIRSGDAIEEVLAKQCVDNDPNIVLYLAEIRSLTDGTEILHSEADSLTSGTLRIAQDGRVEYSTKLEQELVETFIAKFPEACRNIFSSNIVREQFR
jgi:hypothetical protein